MALSPPPEHRGKEIWSSSRRRSDLPCTQESITSQQRRVHTEGNPSAVQGFSLRTEQRLRTGSFRRLSIDDANAHIATPSDGNRTPQGCRGSAAKNSAKEKAGAGSNSGSQLKNHAMGRAGMNLGGEMSQNHHATRKTGMVARGKVLQNHTSMKADMSSSGGMSQQHRTAMKAGSSSGRLPQKNNGKEKMMSSQLRHLPDIQVNRIITEPHAARQKKHTKSSNTFTRLCTSQPIRTKKSGQLSTTVVNSYTVPSLVTHHGSTTARDKKESAANEIKHAVAVKKKDEEEADRVIQQLNEQGLGEDMSHEEYLSYQNKLPCQSPHVDTKTKLHGVELNELETRLALHRFNYVKWLKKTPRNEPRNDELKDDYLIEETLDCVEKDMNKLEEKCSLDFLEENIECIKEDGSKLLVFLGKHGFFKHFEKDGTLDWFFHPEHCALACLDDYQRLVPRNFGGFEYVNWDEYRRYFHSYEIEKEYVQYCEELSEKLKWMEDYVLMKPASRTWRRVFTRGNDQATKIAAGYSKITWRLASNGYHEVMDNLSFDVCWYKELDGVYFEVWQRITKLKKSFRDALEDVYNLNKFPLRQSRMKRALETDSSKMENEFYTCTEGITGKVTDQRAQELISEAVRKLKEKPKFYEHYIKKKISVARVIGLIRD